jgi:glycosyltransferase involved in cell wall biosynthesis
MVGLADAWRADFVFIHREAAPLGPPVYEWFIVRILKRKLIYDFDDAIWLTDKTVESRVTRMLKWRRKVSTICKLAHRVSCGNEYLANYARNYNDNVSLVPTTIDVNRLHIQDVALKSPKSTNVIVGWTGSHSTLKYLYTIAPVLRKIEEMFSHVSFMVIADTPPALNLNRIRFVQWSKESEIADLAEFNIGIMPLPDDQWSKGKGGFKILQYMALGIPSASSPVGINSQIVKHGENGFLCVTEDDWVSCLKQLIESASLRERFGKAGWETVHQGYSVSSNASTFLSLFK